MLSVGHDFLVYSGLRGITHSSHRLFQKTNAYFFTSTYSIQTCHWFLAIVSILQQSGLFYVSRESLTKVRGYECIQLFVIQAKYHTTVNLPPQDNRKCQRTSWKGCKCNVKSHKNCTSRVNFTRLGLVMTRFPMSLLICDAFSLIVSFAIAFSLVIGFPAVRAEQKQRLVVFHKR